MKLRKVVTRGYRRRKWHARVLRSFTWWWLARYWPACSSQRQPKEEMVSKVAADDSYPTFHFIKYIYSCLPNNEPILLFFQQWKYTFNKAMLIALVPKEPSRTKITLTLKHPTEKSTWILTEFPLISILTTLLIILNITSFINE